MGYKGHTNRHACPVTGKPLRVGRAMMSQDVPSGHACIVEGLLRWDIAHEQMGSKFVILALGEIESLVARAQERARETWAGRLNDLYEALSADYPELAGCIYRAIAGHYAASAVYRAVCQLVKGVADQAENAADIIARARAEVEALEAALGEFGFVRCGACRACGDGDCPACEGVGWLAGPERAARQQEALDAATADLRERLAEAQQEAEEVRAQVARAIGRDRSRMTSCSVDTCLRVLREELCAIASPEGEAAPEALPDRTHELQFAKARAAGEAAGEARVRAQVAELVASRMDADAVEAPRIAYSELLYELRALAADPAPEAPATGADPAPDGAATIADGEVGVVRFWANRPLVCSLARPERATDLAATLGAIQQAAALDEEAAPALDEEAEGDE